MMFLVLSDFYNKKNKWYIVSKLKDMFDEKKCDIPTIWCGESDKPPKKRKDGSYYYKTGTRYECMKKGFGAGSSIEKKEHRPKDSLQQIKYIGEKHEKNFKKKGIKTTTALIKYCKGKDPKEIEKFLKGALKNSNGVTDTRSYNCVLLYLYKHGTGNLPSCVKIKA